MLGYTLAFALVVKGEISMIIIVGSKKQILRKAVSMLALVLVLVFSLVAGVRYLSEPSPVFNRFTEEKVPTGNPLRVDNGNSNGIDQSVEQFVIKLQDFYYEERE